MTRSYESWVGRQVGPFFIERLIGSGGMGVVFSARLGDGHVVALKVMAMDVIPETIQRFRRECAILDQVRHPGVVRIRSSGQLPSGEHYYTMDLLTEPTLKDILAERLSTGAGPFGTREMEGLVGGLLATLDALHSRGIFHRDIKPSNILVRHGFSPVLIDFGLVGLVESQLTASGVVLGSMRYMSPELARGQKVDGRSDLYQVGLVAYEMLTLRPVYADAAVFFGTLATGQDPIFYPPGIGEECVGFLRLALAPAPEKRFQNAGAMAEAVGSLSRSGQPHQSRRATPGLTTRVSGPGRWGWLVAAMAAMAAVAGFALWPDASHVKAVRVSRGIHTTSLEVLVSRPVEVRLAIDGPGESTEMSSPSREGVAWFSISALEPGSIRGARLLYPRSSLKIEIPGPPPVILTDLSTRVLGNDLAYRWIAAIPLSARLKLRSGGRELSIPLSSPTTTSQGVVVGAGPFVGVVVFAGSSLLGESWESEPLRHPRGASEWRSLVQR